MVNRQPKNTNAERKIIGQNVLKSRHNSQNKHYTPARYLISTAFTAVLNKGSGSLHKNIKKQSNNADWLNRLLSSTLQYLNVILTFEWCLWSNSDCRFSSFAVQIMRNLIMEMTPSEKQWLWLYLIKRPKSLGKHCRLFIAKQEGEDKLKQIMLGD